MKCSHCGRDNRTQAGFCAWCGKDLATEEKSSKPVVGQSPELSAENPRLDTNPTESVATVTAPDAVKDQVSSTSVATVTDHSVPTGADGGNEASPSVKEPLRPGTLLQERYRIVELLASTPENNTYSADDLARCAGCGFDGNTPDSAYCDACGAAREPSYQARIVERRQALPESYDSRFTEGDREYFVTEEVLAKPQQAPVPHSIRLRWGQATDKGLQRDHNEDYVENWFYTTGNRLLLGLFVVADGLGGQDAGEVASKMTTESVWTHLRTSVWEPLIRGESMGPEALEQATVEAVLAANQEVYDQRILHNSDMSTTITLALIVNNQAFVANVGDSRTYIWNAHGLQRITKDHSFVQQLVDSGAIAPDEIYTHPRRNLIYQSIGDRPDLRPDIFQIDLAVDDHLVLCSDGLWEMVRDPSIEEVLLSEPDPQRACDRLQQLANLAGGEDNISVIIVKAFG